MQADRKTQLSELAEKMVNLSNLKTGKVIRFVKRNILEYVEEEDDR